jgi:hypothetical protein
MTLAATTPRLTTESDEDMNHATTPVFDSPRAAVLHGEQRHGGGPPRHPDIYRELCREFGHEVVGGRTAYIPPPRRTLDYVGGHLAASDPSNRVAARPTAGAHAVWPSPASRHES